ncbi:ATP-binding cassette domain-containing protein [Glycomyces arizonensis]|uniref:ATP-binding cassette domain-containing protein n=1 Tax=Glycomyces arizonensis TaxID=256035 RepID=UPI00047B05CC|nr:ATP-binding cassette domain-containing protein [Glycomyces arizonensis]
MSDKCDGAAPVSSDEAATVAFDRTVVFERPHHAGPPFLAADRLTAKGRRGPVFADVSLGAELGQLVVVSGDGGDGRTALLLALAGRFALSGGTLIVEGRTRAAEIRRRFTVAQAAPAIGFDAHHTVGDCIKETTAVSGKAATDANIHAWLDRLAVGVDTGDTVALLPRFEQIRFAIACAAASRTPAVVVDDADAGLNGAGGERVLETLRAVADAGQLVLAGCVRHDPPADLVIDLRTRSMARAPRLDAGRDRNGDAP